MTEVHHFIFNTLELAIQRSVPIQSMLDILIEKEIIKENEKTKFNKKNGMKRLISRLRRRNFETFVLFVECILQAAQESNSSISTMIINSIRGVAEAFDEEHKTNYKVQIPQVKYDALDSDSDDDVTEDSANLHDDTETPKAGLLYGFEKFLIADIRVTGERIGRGLYGGVIGVMANGVKCIAKEYNNRIDAFKTNCFFHSSLKHRNIIQFIGTHYEPTLIVVLEQMEMNFNTVMSFPNLTFAIKIDILHDISEGMAYLHAQNPPIVHCDISPRHVLFSKSLCAKISAFNFSRVMDGTENHINKPYVSPVQQLFNPPEFDTPIITPKFDVYSFGMMCAHMLIGVDNFQGTAYNHSFYRYLQPFGKDVKDLIRGCVAREREERISSSDAVEGMRCISRENPRKLKDIVDALNPKNGLEESLISKDYYAQGSQQQLSNDISLSDSLSVDTRTIKPEDTQSIGDLVVFKKHQLGRGQFGFVFKGTYQSRPCAVKILTDLATEIMTSLPTADRVQTDALKYFQRECKFLESFKHHNVVQHLATQIHPDSQQPMLVTELMEQSLRDYYKEKTSCKDCHLFHGDLIPTMISLSFDITCALQYLHSCDIVHRDLCGDNVLLSQTSVCPMPLAKVADFGMSRIINSDTRSKSLTGMGHRLGYLPPEATLIDVTRYDKSLDIFCLGAIVIQIVNQLQTLGSAEDRNKEMEKVPAEHVLKPVIQKCLRENPDERPLASDLKSRIEYISL